MERGAFAKRVLLVSCLAAALLVSGCAGPQVGEVVQEPWPASVTAKDVVPASVPGYTTVDTDKLVVEATRWAEHLALPYAAANAVETGGVSLAVWYAADFTTNFYECITGAGAVRTLAYFKSDDPIYGGLVAAVSPDQVKDPSALVPCIAKSIRPQMQVEPTKPLQRCAAVYTVKTPSNTFYVLVEGTDTSVCRAICESVKDQACPASLLAAPIPTPSPTRTPTLAPTAATGTPSPAPSAPGATLRITAAAASSFCVQLVGGGPVNTGQMVIYVDNARVTSGVASNGPSLTLRTGAGAYEDTRVFSSSGLAIRPGSNIRLVDGASQQVLADSTVERVGTTELRFVTDCPARAAAPSPAPTSTPVPNSSLGGLSNCYGEVASGGRGAASRWAVYPADSGPCPGTPEAKARLLPYAAKVHSASLGDCLLGTRRSEASGQRWMLCDRASNVGTVVYIYTCSDGATATDDPALCPRVLTLADRTGTPLCPDIGVSFAVDPATQPYGVGSRILLTATLKNRHTSAYDLVITTNMDSPQWSVWADGSLCGPAPAPSTAPCEVQPVVVTSGQAGAAYPVNLRQPNIVTGSATTKGPMPSEVVVQLNASVPSQPYTALSITSPTLLPTLLCSVLAYQFVAPP